MKERSASLLIQTPEGTIEKYDVYPGIQAAFVSFQAPEAVEYLSGHGLRTDHCRKGQLRRGIDGREIRLSSGDFSVGMAGDGSSMVFPEGHYEGVTFLLDTDILTARPPEVLLGSGVGEVLKTRYMSGQQTAVIPGNESTEQLFSCLYEAPQELKLSYLRIKSAELLLWLSRRELTLNQGFGLYRGDQVDIIRQVHEKLMHNLDQRFTIEELAREHLLNPTTLKNMFKAVYGNSIAAHIRGHRLEKAAELLLEGNESVASIAKQVGYVSQSKFSSVFRQRYGLLPTEYRKKKR